MTICNNCGADNENNVTGYCYQCLSQLNPDQSENAEDINKTTILQKDRNIDQPYQAASGSRSAAGIAVKPQVIRQTSDSKETFTSQDSAATQPVKRDQDNSDKDIAFEIKEVSFDESSVPGLVSPLENPDAKQTPEANLELVNANQEKTDSMENELDLFQDDDLRFTMEKTENGPVVSLTDTSEFQSIPEIPPQELVEEPASTAKPKELTKEELLSTKSQPVSETQRILVADTKGYPSLVDSSVTTELDHPPVQDDAAKLRAGRESNIKFMDNALNGPRPTISQGIAYISGGSISFAGGYKPALGDIVTIADTAYKIKEKPSGKIPNYMKIGGGAVLFLIILMALFSLSPVDNGQIVGILVDPGTNNIIPGAMISIKELDKTTQTNKAGFFIFDDIPPGIYTVEFLEAGVGVVSEKITVLEDRTSAAKFSLPVDNSAAELSDNDNLKPTGQEEKTQSLTPGFMKLKLTPAQANVYYDGKYIGKGNQTFKVPAGKHELAIKYEGYTSETKTVDIIGDQIKTITIALNKTKSTDKPEKKTDLETAAELEQEGKYSEALNYYNKILAKKDDDLNAILGQARCLKAKGVTDESLTAFLKAVAISGDRNDIETQLEALNGILDINPNYLTALYKRGLILLDRAEYFRAAQDFNKVIEIDRRHLNAFYKLGEAYYKAQNYPAAIEAYLKIQELNFADAKPFAYIAKSYMKLDDKKNTKKYYEKFDKNADMSTKGQFNSDPEWQQIKMMAK